MSPLSSAPLSTGTGAPDRENSDNSGGETFADPVDGPASSAGQADIANNANGLPDFVAPNVEVSAEHNAGKVSAQQSENAEPAKSGSSSGVVGRGLNRQANMASASPATSGPVGKIAAPLWLLALVTFSGTLAMHIFVPALPLAATGLNAAPGAMQLTISIYILGLAVGQLLYGPISDRFGRRPTLMFGLSLYTIAGVGAVLAPEVNWLIAARLFQALGGCAGLVLGRAIVRDTCVPTEATRRLALMNLMVTLGPGFAPLLGGLMAGELGWRSVLVFLCVLGVVNIVLTWRLLPETGGNAVASSGLAVVRNYFSLLRSPSFLGYAIGGGCATTAMYAFIGAAPFIFVHQLNRPTEEVGPYLAVLILGVWFGSLLAGRLIRHVPLRRLLVVANLVSAASAFGLLAVVLSGHLSVFAAVGLMFLFTLGAGTASPAALTEAISVNPQVIGSASGLYGSAQMAIGAICTALAGLGDNPALAAASVLAAAGIISQLSFWIALRFAPARAAET
ncbi:multidrug effflux MFS transporter [Thalassospira marina]|nr:multidrug effflux MFS transporter [Thalassospira marina]